MQKKYKNNKPKIILISLIIIVILAIIGIIVLVNIFNNGNKSVVESNKTLNGIYVYNESVKYEFDGKSKGNMYDGDSKYEYTYVIDDKKLSIDFKDEMMYDATYEFTLENDTLVLIGREGTTGGEYTLNKEK